MIEEQEKKQIDGITNQKKRLAAVTNKDDHKNEHKDTIKESTDEIKQKDLLYYFKSNTSRKRCDDFNTGEQKKLVK